MTRAIAGEEDKGSRMGFLWCPERIFFPNPNTQRGKENAKKNAFFPSLIFCRTKQFLGCSADFFLKMMEKVFFSAFGNNRRKVYEMENIEFRVESGNQS